MRSRGLIRFFVAFLAVWIVSPLLAQGTRHDMIVSTEWLAQRLDGQVIVIDVADKDDYDKGHIPAARLLERKSLIVEVEGVPNEVPPLAEFETLMTQLGVGEKKRVVFYSRDPLLATRAWFTFDYLGHGHRASVLNGGYLNWVAEGKETTTNVATVEPAEFKASVNAGAITSLKVMRALVQTRSALGNSLAVIDARPDASYQGETAGAGVQRAGHIPGAINVHWQKNLTGPDNGALFRSDDELRGLYSKLGLNRGTTVITYCRTGVEASMTYFVLRYLGYDPSLYDGSYVEWSGDRNTPVV